MSWQVIDRVNELGPHLGSGEPVIRVAGLGERGLRWRLEELNEETHIAVVKSADGKRRCTAHVLDLVVAPLAITSGGVSVRAKKAMAKAWSAMHPKIAIDEQGYVAVLEDNLIAGVTVSLFGKELAAGDGGELANKIRAVHSSAALVVNTFAPWKQQPELLTLAGQTQGVSILGLPWPRR